MSRIFKSLAAFAAAFASAEMAAAVPHVQTALVNLPNDLVASKPLVAFTKTVHDAMQAMSNDPNVTPSLTGILGAAAQAFLVH